VRHLSSLAWRSLRARSLRSFLTAAGVALGVAVLFASLSAGATMDAAVERAAADEMGRSSLRIEALEERGLSPATLGIVEQTPGVEVVAPALERRTYLAAGLSRTPGGPLPAPVTVLGIDQVTEPQLHDMPLSGGRLLGPADTYSAVIAGTLAGQEGLRLGDKMTLSGAAGPGPTEFTIVGILAGDGYVPGASGRLALVPLGAAQSLFDVQGVTRRA
jgi:ABC-type lipoprotein release transport system permease subunit